MHTYGNKENVYIDMENRLFYLSGDIDCDSISKINFNLIYNAYQYTLCTVAWTGCKNRRLYLWNNCKLKAKWKDNKNV